MSWLASSAPVVITATTTSSRSFRLGDELLGQLGILPQLPSVQLVVKRVDDVARIGLEAREGFLEVTGLDTAFLLQALLYRLGSGNATS